MSELTSYEKLLHQYAGDKPICNCGQSYKRWIPPVKDPYGPGIYEGRFGCKHGCSANQLDAVEYICGRVLEEQKQWM